MSKEFYETKRVLCVEAVDAKKPGSVWVAAFQMYAVFGSRKAGVNAALTCWEFIQRGDEKRTTAWESVCDAILELRYCMFVP
jgi:hypothetical protein